MDIAVIEAWDVVILGAGAAGLMCAMTAGARGRRVLVLDHAGEAGAKIRVSGGGRCNFTNLHATRHHYLSSNPRFCHAALSAFTPQDFVELLDRHGIRHHEKQAGQLFCDGPASQIVEMLVSGCRRHGVRFGFGTRIHQVSATSDGFRVESDQGAWSAASVVVALGGRARPKLGATGLGYEIARRFGLGIVPPRPGLTPLTFAPEIARICRDLAGVALEAEVRCKTARFKDALLFTHQGLSGPAILQISSHWREGEEIVIDLAPGQESFALLKEAKTTHPKQAPVTPLSRVVPRRVAEHLVARAGCAGRLAEIPDSCLRQMAGMAHHWSLLPTGAQGYARAEVTVGGVDTSHFHPGTLACRSVSGLYFIGEVLDVTGWLGGFNLQWAWSSGHAAGRSA